MTEVAVGWLRRHISEILVAILATIVASAVTAAMQAGTDEPLLPSQELSIAVTTALAILLALFFAVRAGLDGPLRRYYEPRVTDDLRRRFWADLTEQIGLDQVFVSFLECEGEILEKMETSKRVDIFLQIGKTVLSGGTSFYDYLERAKLRDGAAVRILHARTSNRYLSERTARERGSSLLAWRDDLDNAARKVRTLQKATEQRVEARQHDEGFVWRIFLFDDVAYVSRISTAKTTPRAHQFCACGGAPSLQMRRPRLRSTTRSSPTST
ncbi:MAG: hypothetical protein LH624_09300 [Cryobacterium sp.]|nr:hypothetical protein [Cryobacterium sp.]